MTISRGVLTDHHNSGFKLVPLTRDSRTPNVNGLLTEVENRQSIEESKDKKGHPINYMYHHPEFWSDERFEKESWRFQNVGTTYGKTHRKDKDGHDLYLNELDIDSKEVFTKLAIIRIKDKDYFFIDEMCRFTFVVKTKKTYGYRIYWLSHKQNQAIGIKDCKLGCEFEIKTDNTLGHGTLPPSHYRDDTSFRYKSIGQKEIAILDKMYDGILKLVSDHLKHKKEKTSINKLDESLRSNKLTDEEIQQATEILAPYYKKGYRHRICYALSGLLHKQNIGIESATTLIKSLAKSDEEIAIRITNLKATYNKDRCEVSGYYAFFLSSIVFQVTMPRQEIFFVL